MATNEEFNKYIIPLIPKLKNYIDKIVNKHILYHGDKDDLLQESLFRMYKGWSKVVIPEQGISTWAHTITTNLFLNWYRRTKQKCNVQQMIEGYNYDSMVSRLPIPETEYTNAQVRETIRNALSAIKDKYTVPFMLHHVKGISYPKISKQLELPKGTIKSRISRCKKSLQEQLTKNNCTVGEMYHE